MASNSKKTEGIRRRKRTKAGQARKRKARLEGSTPPREKIIPPEQ